MARAIDWRRVERLKAQGRSDRAIARELDIPWTTFHREMKQRDRPPSAVHPPPGERVPSTVHPIPSTVDRLQSELSAALTAALQPVLDRLEALERGIARPLLTCRRPPSTVVSSTVHPHTLTRPPSTMRRGSQPPGSSAS